MPDNFQLVSIIATSICRLRTGSGNVPCDPPNEKDLVTAKNILADLSKAGFEVQLVQAQEREDRTFSSQR